MRQYTVLLAVPRVMMVRFGVGKLNGWPVKVQRDIEQCDTGHSDLCEVGQCLPGFPLLQRILQSDLCQLPCIPCDNW